MKEVKRRRTSGLSRTRQYQHQGKQKNSNDFSSKQGYAVGIIFLLICGTVFGLWAIGSVNAYLHPCKTDLGKPGAPCNDPSQIIWQGLDNGAHTLDNWKQHIGNGNSPIQYKAPATCNSVWGLPNTQGCIDMNYAGNSTVTLIDQTPIGSLSSASKNLLGFHFTWGIRVGTNFPLRQLTEWGYFLTTNSTPRTNWAPGHVELTDGDPSVLYQNYWTCFAGCFVNNNSNTMNIQEYSFLKRAINGQPYIDDIYNENQGCGQTGSAYFCANGLNIVTSNVPNQAFQFDSAVYLNYTGVTNGGSCSISGNPGVIQSGSSGCSWQLNEPLTGNSQSQYWLNSQNLPWFQLQNQQLYIGFFVGPTLGSDPAFSFNSNGAQPGMDIFSFTPTTTAPPFDTSVFFAPGLQTLWNGLSFIASAWLQGVQGGANILNQLGFAPAVFAGLSDFFSFVENGLRAILNNIGNAFGLGNLGDNLISFFGGIINWFTNVFGGAIGQLGNIANGIGGGITALGSIFTGFGVSILGFITGIGQLPSIILTLWNLFLPAAYTISFVIVLWWLFGLYQSWRDWTNGDIMGMFITLVMFGGLILILASTAGVINPIAANTTVQGNYLTGFNQMSWFFIMLVPIFLVSVFSNFGSTQGLGGERHQTLTHWFSWARMTEFFIVKLYQITFIIAKESWGALVVIKTLVAGWL